jgi:hypothetical protein
MTPDRDCQGEVLSTVSAPAFLRESMALIRRPSVGNFLRSPTASLARVIHTHSRN